jgi:hypothetical protein
MKMTKSIGWHLSTYVISIAIITVAFWIGIRGTAWYLFCIVVGFGVPEIRERLVL